MLPLLEPVGTDFQVNGNGETLLLWALDNETAKESQERTSVFFPITEKLLRLGASPFTTDTSSHSGFDRVLYRDKTPGLIPNPQHNHYDPIYKAKLIAEHINIDDLNTPVNQKGQTFLQAAMGSHPDYKKVAKILLRRGANPFLRGNENNTVFTSINVASPEALSEDSWTKMVLDAKTLAPTGKTTKLTCKLQEGARIYGLS